jgi:hypothetical protein
MLALIARFVPVLCALLGVVAAPSSTSATPSARATVTTKVYKIAHPQYGPGKFSFPVVRAPSEAATRAIGEALKKIKNTIYDVEDRPQSLTDMSFKVKHNGDNILSLSLDVDSMGAYPELWSEHHAFLLTTGEELTAKMIFEPAKLEALAARVDIELQKEIARSRRGELPGEIPECKDTPIERTFSVEDLQSFYIDLKGITFNYVYAFPHAGHACEPPGQLFLSFVDLGPFLRNDGPLSGIVKAAPPRRGR